MCVVCCRLLFAVCFLFAVSCSLSSLPSSLLSFF